MTETSAPPPITPEQCRRARELLGWNMLDLAEASGVRMVALMRLEEGRKPPAASRVEKVRRAFEEAGVEFLPEDGVRLRERQGEALAWRLAAKHLRRGEQGRDAALGALI